MLKTFTSNTMGEQLRVPHRPKNKILEQINRNASVRKKEEQKTKLRNQIELLSDTLKLHDKKVDEHFPKDERKVPAYAKAQYMDLFSVLQDVVKSYEFTAKWHKTSKKAIEILVTNLNEHSEMVNEIMEDTDFENWTKEEDKHYTNVFYYDLHKTIEETIEEMKEV